MFSGVSQWSLAAQPSSAAPAVHNSGGISMIREAFIVHLLIQGLSNGKTIVLSGDSSPTQRGQPFPIKT